jgi:hypothetical protein
MDPIHELEGRCHGLRQNINITDHEGQSTSGDLLCNIFDRIILLASVLPMQLFRIPHSRTQPGG